MWGRTSGWRMKLIHCWIKACPAWSCRMGLAGDDELHRALEDWQEAQQSRRIVQQQVRSLVGRESARKSECQCIGIEEMSGLVDLLARRARGGELPGQSFASVLDEGLAGGGPKLPEPGIGDPANVLLQGLRRPQPAVLSTRFSPEIIGRCRVPTRHVDAVGDVSDRYFVLRPVGKERLEDVPAHLPVQAADAVDRAAPADGQVGHIETLRRVVRVLAAHRQQIVDGDAKLVLGVLAEVVLDESGSEAVEARGDRGVGGEEVPRSRGGQCDLERLPGFVHEGPGSFQDGERRMPFIQVADLRLDAERVEQSPSADPQHDLLLETQLRPAPVELAGDAPGPGNSRDRCCPGGRA